MFAFFNKISAPDHLKQTVESDISLNPSTPKKAVRQRSNQSMNYPKPPVEEKKNHPSNKWKCATLYPLFAKRGLKVPIDLI